MGLEAASQALMFLMAIDVADPWSMPFIAGLVLFPVLKRRRKKAR
jgi:hypothetical protein